MAAAGSRWQYSGAENLPRPKLGALAQTRRRRYSHSTTRRRRPDRATDQDASWDLTHALSTCATYHVETDSSYLARRGASLQPSLSVSLSFSSTTFIFAPKLVVGGREKIFVETCQKKKEKTNPRRVAHAATRAHVHGDATMFSSTVSAARTPPPRARAREQQRCMTITVL